MKRESSSTSSLSNRRVTVVGLGRFGGGVGVTRWLFRQGAIVTVSDKASEDELIDSVRDLEDINVTLHLGGHQGEDFLRADLLVVNPAVSKDSPLLQAAQSAGVPRTSEINLFLERCSAPVVGITGSVGKSTTTAMTGAIMSKKFTTHVGGNIGGSLLEDIPQIEPDHVVVLELSSFQLEDLPLIGISPHVALVTNLTPNHLDRHGTMDSYAAAKKNIFRFQCPDDVLILNSECDATKSWGDESPGKVEFFDPSAGPFELSIPGQHNQANAQGAWSAARQFGIDRELAGDALREFKGLPHRLQFVRERDGVRYYNDSKCTTPEGAIVAMRAFPTHKVIIIVGGYDKGADFDSLGAELACRAKCVIAIGATREKIVSKVRKHHTEPLPITESADTLDQAVAIAKKLTAPGDIFLLSPACASYEMFTNYEHRGERFIELVTR